MMVVEQRWQSIGGSWPLSLDCIAFGAASSARRHVDAGWQARAATLVRTPRRIKAMEYHRDARLSLSRGWQYRRRDAALMLSQLIFRFVHLNC